MTGGPGGEVKLCPGAGGTGRGFSVCHASSGYNKNGAVAGGTASRRKHIPLAVRQRSARHDSSQLAPRDLS